MSLHKPKAVYAASERNTLQQMEKFKYILVVFTSGGRRSNEADGWIAEDNAVLHERYRSVATKREFSTAKASVLKSVFVPTLTWMVMNLGYYILKRNILKEYYSKCKRQRWDVCEGSVV